MAARRTSPTSPCTRDERRAGVATRLLGALAGEAIRRGCTAWTLEVRATSHGAQDLYRRFGFVPAGRAQEVLRERHRRHRHVVPRHPERRVRRGVLERAPESSVASERRPTSVVGEPDENTWCSASRRAATRRRRPCVLGGNDIASSVVSSQIDLHAAFGGVVPEIASRAHLDLINPVIARAIVEAGVDERRIDAVACTIGPGLIGALLVGVSAAKALALAWDVPFVGVNHLEAHLYAALLEDPSTRAADRRAAGVRRAHDARRDDGTGGVPAARPDDRRRRRRGVRQGRPLPRSRLSRRPGDRAAGPARRPGGHRLPAGDARRRVWTSASPG